MQQSVTKNKLNNAKRFYDGRKITFDKNKIFPLYFRKEYFEDDDED